MQKKKKQTPELFLSLFSPLIIRKEVLISAKALFLDEK